MCSLCGMHKAARRTKPCVCGGGARGQAPENLADPLRFVRRLLDLKELNDRLVRDAFRGEKGFVS